MNRNFNLDRPEFAHAPYTIRDEEVSSEIPGFDGNLPPYIATHNQIGEQDRAIAQEQRSEKRPLALAAVLHIKGPDAMALAYRRALAELGVEF